MLHSLRGLLVALACTALVVACSASANNGSTVIEDGSIGGPGTDSGMHTGQGDGTVAGGDGTVAGGDGTLTGADGSTVGMDGATSQDGAAGDGSSVGITCATGGTGCGTVEICNNGLDDNCNGQVDENCPCLPGMVERCYEGNPCQAGIGVCAFGSQTCGGSGEFGNWGACTGAGMPMPTNCSVPGDYQCNGMVGAGCACMPGTTRSCYTGPAGTDHVGVCHDGAQTCATTAGGSDWGPCTGDVTPTPNVCDGMDRMCTGDPMSGCTCIIGTSRSCYDGPTGTLGVGICAGGSQTCNADADGGVGASSWGPCTGEVTPTTDTCDGIDRSCNGMPMAGCACIAGSTQPCYTGPGGTEGVGICHGGTEMCVVSGDTSVWSTTCAGQVTPLPADVCGDGLDDTCDGTVSPACGGVIACPADQTVQAGSAITLVTTGAGLHGYTWTITSAPTGGASVAVWNPTPPTAATESFLPYIVGVYTIRVSALSASGAATSCSFNVSALAHGLRVELTWDGTGDVDIHVHDGTSSAWFTSDDCYYADLSPSWGAVQDFDNTTANGPENTHINSPVIGESYTVGVENYARAEGRHATIQIFCGTTTGTVPTATYVSNPLTGTDAGNCTGNTFWRVARIVFTSPTACTITPILSYSTGSNACTTL